MLQLTNAPALETRDRAHPAHASGVGGAREDRATRASHPASCTCYSAPRLEQLGPWSAPSVPACDVAWPVLNDDERDAPGARYAPVRGVIQSDLGTELVLLDPAGRQMFSLNPSGRTLWRALPHCTVGEAAVFVAAEFGVGTEQATCDAIALVRELLCAGLLDRRAG